jgi:hypothetical protein
MTEHKGSSPEEMRRLRAQAEAERHETIAKSERCIEAMQEESISGQLRRAIAANGFRYSALEQATGIEAADISDFMSGDMELSSSRIDRLAAALHQQLVATE